MSAEFRTLVWKRSMTKAILRIWCRAWNSNLKSYLEKISCIKIRNGYSKVWVQAEKKYFSYAGRWKNLGVPIVMGGQNLPSPQVGIGLTDRPKMGGGAVGSGIPVHIYSNESIKKVFKSKYAIGQDFHIQIHTRKVFCLLSWGSDFVYKRCISWHGETTTPWEHLRKGI